MEKVEQAFNILNATIPLLQQALDMSFLDAYTENIGNLIDGCQVRVIDGEPKQEIVDQAEAKYQALNKLNLTSEEWRKVTQLVLLKGTHEEPLQANHQLTPDGIGFLFVYLMKSLYGQKKLQILDIASGMGNLLLMTVLNLQAIGYQTSGYGVDVDDTLLEVAAANTELCQGNIQYFHQDGLQDLLIEPVDAAICDLPIGYYPNDERAKQFKTSAGDGHSYAHHLLMEQAMKYVKDGGFGLFLLPTDFLESEQGHCLTEWLGSEVYLQGIIQLPTDFFKSASSRKSIVLFQKRGGLAKQAKEVLLVNLGSLKEPQKMSEFLATFEDWKSSNLKK